MSLEFVEMAPCANAGFSARTAVEPAGHRNPAYLPDDPPGGEDRPPDLGVLAHLPTKQVVSVRLGHKFLSSHPKVIDDFSGSSILSALRVLQKVKNLDGPDDAASVIPTAFSKADQPYIEIGLLSVLFVLVVISAVGAVKAARHGYWVEYPEAVKRQLEHQQILLESLAHEGMTLAGLPVTRSSHDELALLDALHAMAVERHARRQGYRERGFWRLLGHNIASKRKGVPGNGDLAEAFNEEVSEIIAHRMARSRIVASVETCYQVELLDRLEKERHASKQSRTAKLFTGIGMPTMAEGMTTAAGRAAAEAAAEKVADHAAAQAVSHVLETTTGATMMLAQAFQGGSGALGAYLDHKEHRQISRDLEAVQALGELLPAPVQELYRQDSAFRLQNKQLEQAFHGLLATGQTFMFCSNIANFLMLPPVALGLAIPGATLTIAASVCGSINEEHREAFLGAGASALIKQRFVVGNLGMRLRGLGLERVIDGAADGYATRQQQVVQTRLWNDILAVLGEEKLRDGLPEQSGEVRYARVVQRNEAPHENGHLMPAGEKALAELRQARYHAGFLDQPQVDIQKQLAAELHCHPGYLEVVKADRFQQEVLFATADELARRRHPEAWALFHLPGGELRARIFADDAFFEHLKKSPLCCAVFLRRYNETLARHLTPGDRFARNQYHRAVTDLAQTRVRRQALARKAGLDPDVAVSLV